jgi:poly(3-hydroxybutyrate) depolymerase
MNTKPNRLTHTVSPIRGRLLDSLPFALFCMFLMMTTISQAHAQWSKSQQRLQGLFTWIYMPSGTLANHKHALFVVLHGCAQHNTELKEFGNLTAAADGAGALLALPQVPSATQWGPGCWDYDGGADAHQHAQQVIHLTQNLLVQPALNIDKDQIYVVGLSSGGALRIR